MILLAVDVGKGSQQNPIILIHKFERTHLHFFKSSPSTPTYLFPSYLNVDLITLAQTIH